MAAEPVHTVELPTHAANAPVMQPVPEASPPDAMGLLARLCHELDTPVGVAITAASMMPDSLRHMQATLAAMPAEDPHRETLQHQLTMLQEAHELTHAGLLRVLDLLRCCRAARNPSYMPVQAAQRRVVNLRECLMDAIRIPLARFAGRPIECELRVQPRDMEIFTDPGAWNQVITNLVNNSVLHGFDGRDGGCVYVDVTLINDGQTVHLRYRDNGKGMAPGVRERLFKEQVTTRADKGGQGLGTAIMRDVVQERLGGQLSMPEPEPGYGVEFIIEVPRPAS